MAIKQGWSKELAYYCHISSLFSNKRVYKYSSRKLANLLNKSHGTVNTKVNFLIEKGLLSIDDFGNLRCASVQDLKAVVVRYTQRETGNGLLKFKIHDKIIKTEWNLCSRVVLNSLRQQKYKIRKRHEVNVILGKVANNKFVTKKEVAIYHKYKELLSVKNDDTCKLSDQAIAKLTNRSISNVRDMFNFWVNEGLVSSTLIKGKAIEKNVNAKIHQIMKEVNPNYRNTYFYKGKVIEFNKRNIEVGSKVTFRVYSKDSTVISNKQLSNILSYYSPNLPLV